VAWHIEDEIQPEKNSKKGGGAQKPPKWNIFTVGHTHSIKTYALFTGSTICNIIRTYASGFDDGVLCVAISELKV
jgi:hypothetical protein